MAKDIEAIEGKEIYGTNYVASKLGMTPNAIQKWAMVIEKLTGDENYFKHGEKSRSFSESDLNDLKKVKKLKGMSGVSVTDAVKQVFIKDSENDAYKNVTLQIPKNQMKNIDLYNVMVKNSIEQEKQLNKLENENQKLRDQLESVDQKLDKLLEKFNESDNVKPTIDTPKTDPAQSLHVTADGDKTDKGTNIPNDTQKPLEGTSQEKKGFWQRIFGKQ